MIEKNKNQVLLTPYKWSYEERRLFKDKDRTFFEKNYSKWATIEVDKFEDIEIIDTLGKIKRMEEIVSASYRLEKSEDYLVQFFNGTHYIDAEDTYYEYWWGDKSLKKKFDEETKGYGRIEDYIDDTPYMARNTAVIPKEDYVKLKELYKRSDER